MRRCDIYANLRAKQFYSFIRLIITYPNPSPRLNWQTLKNWFLVPLPSNFPLTNSNPTNIPLKLLYWGLVQMVNDAE